MEKYFTKKKVVVMVDGCIVEQYRNLKDFCDAYPLASYNCISQRIRNCLDGWMPDGKTVRYFADRTKAGRQLVVSKIREKDDEIGGCKQWEKDLADTEAKIEAAYDACERGEITYQERADRLGWLQNHAAVLRRRLKIRNNKED